MLFRSNNKFVNINQAVVYLGPDTIKNIAVTASVQQVFSKLKRNEHFSMSSFWWKSFCSAIFAKRIAGQTGYANIEEAYLAGLLHDIGELLLWMNFANECTVIPELIEGKGVYQCTAEEDQIGINHCESGAWLIRQWKLNSFIADTVLYHHSSLEQIKGAFPLVKIVYLAEKCCQVSNDDFTDVYDLGDELFNLKTEQIDEIRVGVEEEIWEVAKSLGMEVKPSLGKNAEQTAEQTSGLTAPDADLLHEVKNFSLLYGFLETLVQAESKDEIFQAIEQAFNIIFDIDTILFFLHDFEEQKLYGQASTLNPYAEQLQNLSLSAEQGSSLLVQSMLQRQIVTSMRDEKDSLNNLADSQLLDAVGGKGMLYIPMVAKRKAVGAIVVGIPEFQGNDFANQAESKLLCFLANQAAICLYLGEVKRKQAEKIQAARMDAASMAAAKVVHEVNNPLGIIRNYLKILEMKLPEKDSLTQDLTIIDEEITRISKIVQQLDTFSSPVDKTCELTDINSLISNLLSILAKSVFYSSQLQVHFTPDPELPAILTNEDSIKQIIINLIKNAAEAMNSGGNVYIKTNSSCNNKSATTFSGDGSCEYVEITIHDDGPGIPAEVLSQLFEPFTSTKGKGHSGLGLAIVKSLVTELKGTIRCTCDCENGTLFTINLPINHSLSR